MHSYSVDTNARQWVFAGLAVVAFALPSGIAQAVDALQGYFASMPAVTWPLSFGATFGAAFWLFDRHLWKHIRCLGIPILDGRWRAEGLSSYQLDPDTGVPIHQFSMDVTIRQTFTRIEVFTLTPDSESRSTMASVCIDSACPVFRYAFENAPRNKANAELQRHPGLIELRIHGEQLQGDYFSGKHRLRFGELTLTRVP